jgi:hypothetical protein
MQLNNYGIGYFNDNYMINKSVIFQLIGLSVILGTISFFLKRYLNFDFKLYAGGILLGFIVYVLLKARKTGK